MPAVVPPLKCEIAQCGNESALRNSKMNTKQQNKLAMYLAVKGVLDSNNSVWQSRKRKAAFGNGGRFLDDLLKFSNQTDSSTATFVYTPQCRFVQDRP
jgi:hypothetical protein